MEKDEIIELENGKRPLSVLPVDNQFPPLQRRRFDDLKSWRDIPDSFSDAEVTSGLNADVNFVHYRKFPLVCGLIIKLRSAFSRVYGRSHNRFPRYSSEQHPQQFFDLVLMHCYETSKLRDEWTAGTLWSATELISVKSVNIDVHLQREIYLHPLFPLDRRTGWPCFYKEYLDRVKIYHDSLRRPAGTFALPESDLIPQLLELPRNICPNCNHARHVYCGPCGGVRMGNSSDLLPARIELPFRVHLVLHW